MTEVGAEMKAVVDEEDAHHGIGYDEADDREQ
jgi:hypothetical protein